MQLVLNEEQQLLKESADGFFKSKAPVSALRALRDAGCDACFDPDVWAETAEMGFNGMVLSEDAGGIGFGYTGAGTVAEAMGRNLSASPWFVNAVLSAPLLNAVASDEQKQMWLPKLLNGSSVMALAIDEGGHYDPAGTKLAAAESRDGFVLSGMKSFVVEGANADAWLVLARSAGAPGSEKGLSLFIVEKGTPGLVVDQQVMADSRNYARLTFEKVTLGKDALVGAAGLALAGLSPILDRAAVVVAAELYGLSSFCLSSTVDYLKERKQFGVVIGTFQGLQHRAAHLFSELELTKSVVLKALMAADTDDPSFPVLASIAKAKACKTAELATNEAIQMHGGIGMTDEMDIGFYIKRARSLQALLGDYNHHADRYARLRGF